MTELTDQQREQQAAFRNFAEEHVAPRAAAIDREQYFPKELIALMAAHAYLTPTVPKQFGGSDCDMVTYGLLNEEIGRACSSARTLLTVHGMAAQAILRWGTRSQRERWLPALAVGTLIGAFALSEPLVGSDARAVQTDARKHEGGYILNGQKKWISFGQIADLFLVFARCQQWDTAFVVERDAPGVTIQPIHNMLGTRGSMLAELHLRDCFVPESNLIARPGFGFSHVATSALDQGKYSVAWGCVGLAQACLEASLRYANERKQFGAYLKDHQLVQGMITEMMVNIRAARLLCLRAGHLKDSKASNAIMETAIAKLFASTIAAKAASDAVQIHGANGCSPGFPVERYLRDAKIMEIIEGTTQIQQISIAQYGMEEYMALNPEKNLLVAAGQS
jgi:glutaryl-CoA dehydrogenase (non-decarboxylating)